MKRKIIVVLMCVLLIACISMNANADNIKKESVDENLELDPMPILGDKVLYPPWDNHNHWTDGESTLNAGYIAEANSDSYEGSSLVNVFPVFPSITGSAWCKARFSHEVNYLPSPGLHDFTFTYYYEGELESSIFEFPPADGFTIQQIWVHFEIEHWKTGGTIHREYSDVFIFDERYESSTHTKTFSSSIQETISDVEIYPEDNNCRIKADFFSYCAMGYSAGASALAWTIMEGNLDKLVISNEITNQPPNKPTITGPSSGEAGISYKYKFTATDPDNDKVSYYIKWGDGEITPWSPYYDSGDVFSKSHTYAEEGTYTIQAKTRDPLGAESDWATLTVTMPRNRATSTTLASRLVEILLERLPVFERLLNLP